MVVLLLLHQGAQRVECARRKSEVGIWQAISFLPALLCQQTFRHRLPTSGRTHLHPAISRNEPALIVETVFLVIRHLSVIENAGRDHRRAGIPCALSKAPGALAAPALSAEKPIDSRSGPVS